MENNEHLNIVLWVLASAGGVITSLVGLWRHYDMRNSEEHRRIYEKIDENHNTIRDKLENIWRHLNKRPGD